MLLLCWLGGMTYAQSNYDEAVAMGDSAFKKGEFQKAIDYYLRQRLLIREEGGGEE